MKFAVKEVVAVSVQTLLVPEEKVAGRPEEAVAKTKARRRADGLCRDGIEMENSLRREGTAERSRIRPPGRELGNVTFFTVSYSRGGKLLSKNDGVVSLHLAPLQLGQAKDRKRRLRRYWVRRVRIVIRANADGMLGANTLFLVDPGTLKGPVTRLKTRK